MVKKIYLGFLLINLSTVCTGSDTTRLRTLLVMFDGLRTDYIRPEIMPRLYAAAQEASRGANHRSVYPTVTRVNAASYITGSYPAVHGLMENSLYLPDIDSLGAINTGNAANLIKVESLTGGKLLAAPSLGELLQQKGAQLFVYSSGTTGQAFLQNHKVNGAIIHPDLLLPASQKADFIQALGTPPPPATPNAARHEWITNALCKYTLVPNGPLVSAIWFSDPDGAAHSHGIGIPITMESIKVVDAQFGRILDSMEARGMKEHFNIIISTDHGFISYRGAKNLRDFLIEKGWKESPTSTDVVTAGCAIYVKGKDKNKIRAIATALQAESWVGALFTAADKKGSDKGFVKGTLSFDAMNWNYLPRVADIVIAQAWDDEQNQYGYAGTAYANGPAGHGGSSKYEMQIPFIAIGPSFKKHLVSSIPSSNIDMVPTVLSLHGIVRPATMQGRVLNELFYDAPPSDYRPATKTITSSGKTNSGKYRAEMEIMEYRGHRYINFFRSVRK